MEFTLETKNIISDDFGKSEIFSLGDSSNNEEIIVLDSNPKANPIDSITPEGIPPFIPLGGGAVGLILALVAYNKAMSHYNKTQIDAMKDFAKTLLKQNKNN